jgi:hypothetical protein
MSARSTASSSSKRASGSRPSGTARASRVIGAGQGLSAAVGGFKDELFKPGRRRAMLAGAGFAAYMTLLFASIAFWWGLSNVMDQGWAALIVTAVWAIVAALLYAASKGSGATRPS